MQSRRDFLIGGLGAGALAQSDRFDLVCTKA
jgi:hypothetical protein